MGTSRNDPSPRTPPWRVTNAVLGDPSVDAARQSLEVWRAATGDPEVALKDSLTHPAIAEACRIAAAANDVRGALASFDVALGRSRAASLQIDMARRALARTVATEPSAGRFAAELFAEVASYYVARDLPSHVAAHGRVGNASAAIVLKDEVREIARQAALSAGPVTHKPDQWSKYVGRVLQKLRGGK